MMFRSIFIFCFLLFSSTIIVVVQAQNRDEILSSYLTSDTSLKMRSAGPQFGRQTDFDLTEHYARGLIPYPAIGVGIAVASLLGTIIFLCINCFCLKRNHRPTCSSTFIVLLISLGVSIAFTCFGLSSNNKFHSAFSSSQSSNTDSIGGTLNRLLFDAEQFIGNLQTTTQNIIPQTNIAVQGVNTKLQNVQTIYVENGPIVLGTAVNSYGENYNNFAPIINNTQYTCTVCTNLKSTADQIIHEITNQTAVVTTTLTTVVSNVDSTLTSVQSQIISGVNSAVSTISDVHSQVDKEKRADYLDKYDRAQEYEKYRYPVMIAIFCCPFLSAILIGLGLATKSSGLLKIHFVFGSVFIILVWLLFAVHWPVGMTGGDSCVKADKTIYNMTESFDGYTATVGSACLVNQSLIQALSLSDDLNFRQAIVIPGYTSSGIDSAFSLTTLQQLHSTVQSQTIDSAFPPFNSNTVNDYIQQINQIQKIDGTYGNYNKQTVENINLNDYSPVALPPATSSPRQQVADLLTNQIKPRLNTEAMFRYTLTSLQQNLTSIVNFQSALKQNTTQLNAVVNSLSTVISPLFSAVDSLENQAYCSYIASDFKNFKDSICEDTLLSIGYITCALFFIGLCYFPLIWLSRLASQHFQSDREQHLKTDMNAIAIAEVNYGATH